VLLLVVVVVGGTNTMRDTPRPHLVPPVASNSNRNQRLRVVGANRPRD